MRLNVCFVLSALLVLVVAFPAYEKRSFTLDPNSWKTYGTWEEEPPFPPPEIGPFHLYLPKNYFEIYWYLTWEQEQGVRTRYSKEYKAQVSITSLRRIEYRMSPSDNDAIYHRSRKA